jgi:hypothetical protein
VTDASVTAEIHQTLDIHSVFATKIALHDELRHGTADACDFRLGQILDRRLGKNACDLADLPRPGASDAEYRRQRNADVFVQRDIYACYTCHYMYPVC